MGSAAAIFILAATGLWAVFWLTHDYFHNAPFWRSRKRLLLQLGKEFGLTPNQQGDGVVGRLAGYPFALVLRSVRLSKSRSMELCGRLEVDGCPEGFRLEAEGLFSAFERMAGHKELSVGEPELDAALWFGGGNLEEVRAYLTEPRRRGLLYGFEGLSHGRLQKGVLESSRYYATPLALGRDIRGSLESYALLAETFRGDGERLENLPVGPSGLIARRLRRFAGRSFAFFLPLYWLTTLMPGYWAKWWQGGFAFGLAFTVLALSGKEWSRVLLQSYYGLLTIFTLATMGLTFTGKLGQFDKTHLGLLVWGVMLAAICWAARHYLKSLDLTANRGRPLDSSPF
jgi:hypothetical protein